MNSAGYTMHAHRHLSFPDKLALWSGWAAAAAVFLTLGWMAMAPDDPMGAVSLLTRRGPLAMLLQAAGLAAVTSAGAAILVGRTVPFAGPFAASVGLAAVALRGQTIETLLLMADAGGMPIGSLAFKLAMETLAWFSVILLSFLVSSVVTRWCLGGVDSVVDSGPRAASWWVPGIQFALIATAASLVAFNILGIGFTNRSVRHAQVCFVVGASVWLGSFVAHGVIRSRGPIWSVVGVALLAIGGYLWAGLRAPSKLPANIPPSHFLRALPLEFIAVGTAAAIASYWSHWRHRVLSPESPDPVEDDLESGR